MNFIFATWLREYRETSTFARNIPSDIYFSWHQLCIERLIARGAKIQIACMNESPDVIYSFLCFEHAESIPHIIHFSYTKGAFRNIGILKDLLKSAGFTKETNVFHSHATPDFKFIKPQFLSTTYNPYLL